MIGEVLKTVLSPDKRITEHKDGYLYYLWHSYRREHMFNSR